MSKIRDKLLSIKLSKDGESIIIHLLGIRIKLKIFNKKTLLFFDLLLPKKKNKIIFASFPDYSDNSKEFFEYMKEYHSNEYELVWLLLDSKKNNPKQKLFSFHHPLGLYHLITSKYIVYTGLYLANYLNFKRHVLLEVWHGMPLKTLGLNEKKIPQNTLKQYIKLAKNGYFFVSSDIFKLSMISSFMMPQDKIFITGQPKTDCILNNRNRENIAEFLNVKKFDKIFLYTPTYKEATRNNRRDIEKEFNNIFYFDDYSSKKLCNFLEEKNALLIIKPHPFDEKFYKEYLKKGNLINANIKFIFNADIKKNNFYFYEFFQHTDLMITDFSSIAIDYLIANKPVLFLDNLSKEYENNRGFIIEDNYNILMPGEKIKSFTELLIKINDAITVDSWKEKRTLSLPLLHKYQDDKSCERIYNIMKEL